MKIKILTDLSAVLPKSIIEKYDIGIVPLSVKWEEENIGGAVESRELFKKMRSSLSETGPKTSQPSIGIFKKFFEESLKNYDEIIYLGISSQISGSVNSAAQALKFFSKEDQEKITIYDSLGVDSSLGIMTLRAAELAQEGNSRKEIVEKMDNLKKNIFLFGFAGDPKWLVYGGRLGNTGAKIVRQLQKMGIRPIFELKKGKVKPGAIKFNAKDKAEALIKEIKGRIKEREAYLVITHSDILNEAEDYQKRLKDECPNIKILFLEEINPIVGSHMGPDSLVSSYYLKKNDV